MNKRVISTFLAFMLLLTIIQFPAFATGDDSNGDRASSYLNMYSAELYASGTSGKLELEFEVVATGFMDSVGVFGIFVRNNDGTIYRTIWGSTANGLLDTNTWYHAGEYTLNLTSGHTYYCTVIVIARDANGSDTRKIITSQVTCP